MQIHERISLLERLGEYMQGNEDEWQYTKQKAFAENSWFMPEFIEFAMKKLAEGLLQKDILQQFIIDENITGTAAPKKIGIALIGSTPLEGLHDIVCVFLTGHYCYIKASSKDEALIKHLVSKLYEWSEEAKTYFTIAPMIKGCDAYIATETRGATQSFNQYFSKYPSIIRKHKTSVAILDGSETIEVLQQLADDIHLYFGLGSHSVAKIYIPEGYDFIQLLGAFKKYEYLSNHHKFKNNYDHNLSLQILNNKYYMTNGTILLVESKALTSPISQLNYEFYKEEQQVVEYLKHNSEVEDIVSHSLVPFGAANSIRLSKFENGINTIDFLKTLN